jgi:hypothetical protein
MKPQTRRRLGLVVVLFLGGLPGYFGVVAQPAGKAEHFDGKVMRLAAVLEKQGAKLDADAADHLMTLVTDDGKTYVLVKDDSTRMFFKDPSLLNRPMRLTGRLLANSGILQVVEVHSYLSGKLHEVYYWCDTCAIRTLEPGDCACCSAKLELREVPVR